MLNKNKRENVRGSESATRVEMIIVITIMMTISSRDLLYLWLTYNTIKERRSRAKNNFMSSNFSTRPQNEQHICVPLVVKGGQPVIREGGGVDLDRW